MLERSPISWDELSREEKNASIDPQPQVKPRHEFEERAFEESEVRKAMYRRRLVHVVETIEDAALWCDGDEQGLMLLLIDAKNLANAA